ncbi:MAG: hypothetical protein WEB87_00230 [Bacteriovoracaceae bacterium]
MSKKARNIVYLGDQRDLFLVISNYFAKREDNFFTYPCLQITEISEAMEKIPAGLSSLVIVDFCETEDPVDDLMLPLCFLKKRLVAQSVPMAGVFNNKRQIAESESLFGLGLNYAFVKGCDHKQALNSLFYIAFEDQTPCLNYAMAKGFKLPAKISSLGFISEFSPHSFTVDKDFQGQEETAAMRTNLFEDFKLEQFLQQESFERGFVFDTMYSETMQIEFSSGWEEGENLLFEDTFASWIDMNKESFVMKKALVMVYANDPSLAKTVWELSLNHAQLDIHLRERFVEDKKEVLQLKPDLVLFQIDGSESHDDLNALLAQMSYEKELNRSIVSVFNHPSSTNALRKLFNRPNLMGSNASMNKDVVKEMLKKLIEARSERDEYSFKLNDPRLNVSFPLDISVTSLTENEITFMSATQFPLYSILKMTTPQDMYVAVIPSLKNLSPNIHGYHYMGFIFGIDSLESSYLRKYVNHILDKGVKEWKRIDLSTREEVRQTEELEALAEEASDADKHDDKADKHEDKMEEKIEMETGFRSKSKNKLTKL